jgi:16S rRNA (cytidine1402-2'-O)-methyltransferase
LETAASILGNRPIVVARELTKVHQELAHGTAASLARQFVPARGEFTVVVGPAAAEASIAERPTDAAVAAEFGRVTETAIVTRRQAIGRVAASFGIAPRDVYAAIERHKSAATD